MSLLTNLLGVDKIVENQNRLIRLLGEEIDSLRALVENYHEGKLQVGVDPEGGVSWKDRPAPQKELQKEIR